MRAVLVVLAGAALVAAAGTRSVETPPAPASPPIAAANDNRVAAGRLARDTLTVRLVARMASWAPDESDSPPLEVAAFAEEGQSPSVPGPLIRVREGRTVRVVLRNALDKPLLVRGLMKHPASSEQLVTVPAGAVREVVFDAGAAGTYLYWAALDPAIDSLHKRENVDSQLNGVIVVDPPAARSDAEILVISTTYIGPDTTAPVHRPERFLVTLNGRSWPHTRRFTYSQGDSVRWRWVNASFEGHPMHLHGFFFRITRSGTMLADSALPVEASRLGVTESLAEGETREIVWVPERAGNWLMHCHLQVHVDPAITGFAFPEGSNRRRRHHGNHALDAMMGLATGVRVLPRGAPREEATARRRVIRLAAERVAGPGRSRVAVGITDPATGLTGAMTSPGAPLVLRVGEPARIWVVNGLDEPTALHWHGLELDSYFDGVAGWSGAGRRLAPVIAPGDSFAADITPVRSGTYIYHSHMEDTHQRGDGLYGPLVVLDSGATWDAARNPIMLLGGRENEDTLPPLLNGSTRPAPLELVAGAEYRVRVINIMENNAREMRLVRGTTPVTWRALARDAAPLPPALAVSGPAVMRSEVGMTFDYAFTPEPGEYRFEVLRRGRVVDTLILRARQPR